MKRAEGDIDGTMKILEQARLDYPETWEVIRFQAEVLRVSKQHRCRHGIGGRFRAQKLVALRGFASRWDACMRNKGDAERATAAWRHASWLDVHDAESLNLIAGVRLRQNRLDEAFKIQQRAVARQPDQPRQYRMLSDILTKMGREDEARAALAQVSQMEAFAQVSARGSIKRIWNCRLFSFHLVDMSETESLARKERRPASARLCRATLDAMSPPFCLRRGGPFSRSSGPACLG